MFSADREKIDASFIGNSGANYQWCLWAILPAVLAGAGALAGAAFLIAAVPSLHKLVAFWIGLLPLHIVSLSVCLIVLAKNVHPGARLAALDLTPVDFKLPRLLKYAFYYTAAFYPVSLLVTTLSFQLLKQLGVQPSVSPMIDFITGEVDLAVIVSVVVVAVLIAPVAEEIMFRLVLYESLRLVGVKIPAVITALLFALLHNLPTEIPALFLLALMLQYARAKSGSLWLPIAIHMLFNAISLALVFLHQVQS